MGRIPLSVAYNNNLAQNVVVDGSGSVEVVILELSTYIWDYCIIVTVKRSELSLIWASLRRF